MIEDVLYFFKARPTIEPQTESADCGFVCASAMLALLGAPKSVQEIKGIAGNTSRGLTLRQVRDVLLKCGVPAVAIKFDTKQLNAYPCPGIILLKHGHYVVIAGKSRDKFEIFDPSTGWSRIPFKKASRHVNGLGIKLDPAQTGIKFKNSDPLDVVKRVSRDGILRSIFFRLSKKYGWRILVSAAFAQVFVLSLPLISMQSVDAFRIGVGSNFLDLVAVGFFLVSFTNTAVNLFSATLSQKLSKASTIGTAKYVFDALASKPSSWFEMFSAPNIQSQISAVDAQIKFYNEFLSNAGALIVTLIVGSAALFFISPLLVVPGIVSLFITIMIDVAFNKFQMETLASNAENAHRRQKFIFDVLNQIPMMRRLGSLRSARNRFIQITRISAAVEMRLNMIRQWRGTLSGAVRSLETLIFVSISAFFMSKYDYTLGGFVALAAYKDLLAQSMTSIFQTYQKLEWMEVHRLRSRGLTEGQTLVVTGNRSIETGHVYLKNVSFSYGTLDLNVIDDISIEIQPGERVLFSGASGAGKSTVARLICGLSFPTNGEVWIDGALAGSSVKGVAAVLQSDRLITGTLRENILLFRRNISDEEIFTAITKAGFFDFVMRLPMRLDTVIGEGVSGLSSGQRQRILIARAILGDPKLLVFDEATSSLDIASEASIMESLVASGITLILIAHRPEVWKFATRVVTIDGGKLVESSQYSDEIRHG